MKTDTLFALWQQVYVSGVFRMFLDDVFLLCDNKCVKAFNLKWADPIQTTQIRNSVSLLYSR